MIKTIIEIEKQIANYKAAKSGLKNELEAKRKNYHDISEKLYQLELKYLHVSEIYRLASVHFSRLKDLPSGGLTAEDIREIEKWIGRAKSEDGLRDIINALRELSKYYPHDIKVNLYGLIQKIIIEGPFKKKPKK